MAGLGSDVKAIQLDRQSRSASQTYSLDDNVSLSIDLMVAAPLEAVDMIFERLMSAHIGEKHRTTHEASKSESSSFSTKGFDDMSCVIVLREGRNTRFTLIFVDSRLARSPKTISSESLSSSAFSNAL
jgi:hypothetical protein